MSYIHLTIEKRSQIEVLRKEGYSVRRIASLIGVHHSTVARELNRIEGEYSAIKAQQLAISKSANKGRPTKLTPQLAALIESRLQQTWSPEEIVGAELVGVLSFKTIYSWIHHGLLTMNRLKTSLEYQCILPMLMQHGNVVLMKIVMGYSENFSLRKPI